MRYLIDTDWVIHHLHGVSRVVDRVVELEPDGLAISIISVAELHEGFVGSADAAADQALLRRLLSTVQLLGLDEETCRIFGRERARLRAEGMMIGDFDLLIGCTALRHGLTVLTNNRRHFGRINGLAIESI